ncbi:DUF1853 family protein [Permianibacter aggregans]|uniref:DUF1853 family protein n=1 Tax=Permianibacter aggregans TaxID=1510150 RepID=A0A4R6USW7_9GAMM|nr:DUF1853 family protein [Permianibacter aggregans]QGX40619.1 DUF1853 family protein [Permianibacter aggregans]TDQ46484.1 hypothetical protein EV696_11325 [Permianibacter aggregans]
MEQRIRQQIIWAFNSPPLLAASHFSSLVDQSLLELPESAVEALDAAESLEHLIRQNEIPTRLGKFFEQLISAGLRCHPRWRERLSNLPIQDDERTVGEIDLIVEQLPSARIEHWEVAVKFYLGLDQLDNPTYWFGPRLTDRLAIKLNKLFHHQLPLARWAQKEGKLPSDLATIAESKALVKGRLFYPLDQLQRTARFANAEHERGVWASASQWRAWLFSHPDARITALRKHDWLLPSLAEQAGEDFKSWLLEQGESISEPQAFYLRSPALTQMIFVVPDSWPDAARDKAADSDE